MKYSIYQITGKSEEARNIKFMGLDIVKNMGLKVTKNIYTKVYEGELGSCINKNLTVLDNIYDKFNRNHPENFRGHSLSTSDVVEINNKFYYCDSFGWAEIWK